MAVMMTISLFAPPDRLFCLFVILSFTTVIIIIMMESLQNFFSRPKDGWFNFF